MHEVRQRFHQRTKTAASKAVSRTLSAIDTEVCNKTTFRLSLVFVRTLTDNVSLPAFARRCCLSAGRAAVVREHSSKPAAVGLLL